MFLMKIKVVIVFLFFCCHFFTYASVTTLDASNQQIEYFSDAKKKLLMIHASDPILLRTFYCQAQFDADTKKLTLPDGFDDTLYHQRSQQLEFEHIVPAENFGRAFVEWREGHPNCVDSKNKSYKGRRCATKMNRNYRFMQADLYNLYPAIGSVNAARKNYNFLPLGQSVASSFGLCVFKIDDRKVEPADYVKGFIARTYLYMHETYEQFKMSKSQYRLMQAWNNQYAITEQECVRYQLIKKIQGSENNILKKLCFKSK